jgi:hypothetical protein
LKYKNILQKNADGTFLPLVVMYQLTDIQDKNIWARGARNARGQYLSSMLGDNIAVSSTYDSWGNITDNILREGNNILDRRHYSYSDVDHLMTYRGNTLSVSVGTQQQQQQSFPVLQGAITGVVGGGVGGFAGGFTGGLLMTGNLGQAFNSGLQGMAIGMGIGGAVGAGYGYKNAIDNNLNPWTGKPNTVEAPQQTPYQKGLEGVNRAEQEIISQGGTPLTREVTLEVGDVRVRLDIAADFNGEIHLIEVKNGPSAGFTPNQKIAYPQMADGVRVPVIPRGTNALPITTKYPQLWQIGQATTQYRLIIIHY